MARSTYVYVVMESSPMTMPPLATFTVKREMKRMLKRLERETPSILSCLSVFRMDDGQIYGGMIAEMDINEILEGR